MKQNDIYNELSKRHLTTLNTQLSTTLNLDTTHLLLTAAQDIGVIRNGGRSGSRFAPEAILNILKKMAALHDIKIGLHQVATEENTNKDFDQLQLNELNNITECFARISKKNSNIVHLGGGHDHIYCLAHAIFKSYKKPITIINIDAHLDTRTDSWAHSGTPFRQLAKEKNLDLELIQIGIHPYSNVKSNYQKLEHGKMKIFNVADWRKIVTEHNSGSAALKSIVNFSEERNYILSLDADAIHAGEMEAVSAVNPNGFLISEIEQIVLGFKQLSSQQKFFGIYEYNPVFDNLSQKGAKVLSAIIYQWFL